MFERSYLKEMSKQRMRGFRGRAILVSLICAILCGTQSSPNIQYRFNFNLPVDSNAEETFDQIFSGAFLADLGINGPEDLIPFIAIFAVIALVALVVGLLYSIFVGNVIMVGSKGWFLRYSRGEYPSVGEMFASFRIYLPVVVTSLLRRLYEFLWSLLFIFPGIVKSYAYSMADFIIYENPNMPANEAIRLSEKLTKGAKWDLFVFDLSYIGWNILNFFTLGILNIVYIAPYKNTALAAIYDSLKITAIQTGRLTWEDFGQTAPVYPQNPTPDMPPYPAAPYSAPSYPAPEYPAPAAPEYPAPETPAIPPTNPDDQQPTGL